MRDPGTRTIEMEVALVEPAGSHARVSLRPRDDRGAGVHVEFTVWRTELLAWPVGRLVDVTITPRRG